MSFISAGIKEAFIAPRGTGFSDLTASTVHGMGTRQNGSLVITHINETQDRTGKKFPNMLNFKAEVNTMQIMDLTLLQDIIAFSRNGGCDVAILSSGIQKSGAPAIVTAPDGGLFVFRQDANKNLGAWTSSGVTVTTDINHGLTRDAIGSPVSLNGQWRHIISVTVGGDTFVVDTAPSQMSGDAAYIYDRYLGIDFDLTFSLKERVLKLTLEGAMRYEAGLELVKGSGVRQIGYSANKIPSIDDSKVSAGFINPSYIPQSCVAYFDDALITDFSCTVKSKSSKNGFNTSLMNAITVEMKATCSGADYMGIQNILKHETFSSDIIIDLDPSAAGTKNLIFSRDGITKIGEVTIDDDKREASFTLTGEYDPDYTTYPVNGVNFNKYL